jgi:methylenetetrahydrofolate reductase (NADPH)
MSQYKPLFIDVTWGAGGRTSELTLDLCINAKAYCHLEPQMHLTCTNMPIEQIDAALLQCKENGIRNILALRGGKFCVVTFD